MQRELEALRHQLQSLAAQLESSRGDADATRACLAAAEQGIAALEAVRSELQDRVAALEGSAASQAVAISDVSSSPEAALPCGGGGGGGGGGAQPGDAPAVIQLLEMGFERSRVLQALASNGDNVEMAIMALLG
jgi:uncharacterized coiled-coil protein SlyX